jgi:NUMOD4 motif/HNH endonuclease
MNNEVEIWKDIPNYEGLYQCSNFGNVKSVDRFIKRNGFDVFLKGVKLKPNGDGRYLHVILYKKNKSFTGRIHVLVSMTFLGHNSLKRNIVINHINGNKFDNNLFNLEIVSQRENVSKAKNKENTLSKYIGVTFDKHKNGWKSQIRINNKSIHLGLFKNEYDANLAYQKKLKELSNE